MNKNEIAFCNDAGQDITVSRDDIRRLVCPDATDNEIDMFMAHCAAHKLDPIGSKDAYLVKYRGKDGSYGKASIITSYHVFNRRARKFPDYEGIRSGVVVLTKDGRVIHKNGCAVYGLLGETLIGAWAEVYVKGWAKPAYVEVSYDDFNTNKNNWKKMPGLMIEKVAKCQAWRLAFPEEFQDMYLGEEMEQDVDGNVREVSVELPTACETPVYEVRAEDHLTPIRELVKPFAKKVGCDMAKAVSLIEDYAGGTRMEDIDPSIVPDICNYMRGVIEQDGGAE